MTTTLTHLLARELYALERRIDPTLPEWDAATWMTRSYWMRKANEVPAEKVAVA